MHFWGSAVSAYEKFLRTGNISYLYQMDSFDKAVVTAYFVVLAILSFYGIHRYLMVFLYRRYGRNVPVPLKRFEDLPRVTVHECRDVFPDTADQLAAFSLHALA